MSSAPFFLALFYHHFAKIIGYFGVDLDSTNDCLEPLWGEQDQSLAQLLVPVKLFGIQSLHYSVGGTHSISLSLELWLRFKSLFIFLNHFSAVAADKRWK